MLRTRGVRALLPVLFFPRSYTDWLIPHRPSIGSNNTHPSSYGCILLVYAVRIWRQLDADDGALIEVMRKSHGSRAILQKGINFVMYLLVIIFHRESAAGQQALLTVAYFLMELLRLWYSKYYNERSAGIEKLRHPLKFAD